MEHAWIAGLASLAAALLTAAAGRLAEAPRRRGWRRLTAALPGGPGAPPTPPERRGAGPGRGPRRAWARPGAAARDRRAVAREVPFLLDLLVLGADGGLNLHQALEAAGDLVDGPLREALGEVRRRTRTGLPLARALEGLAERWNVEEVRTFVRILRIGQALGTPVGEALRQASAFLRERQRLETQRRLAAVPLQITLCTLFFFLPPVFVILLVPNLLNFVGSAW